MRCDAILERKGKERKGKGEGKGREGKEEEGKGREGEGGWEGRVLVLVLVRTCMVVWWQGGVRLFPSFVLCFFPSFILSLLTSWPLG